MGVVHHSVYPVYLEQARIDWLKNIGMHYQKMEDNGIILPLKKLILEYKKSAVFGDRLKIEVSLSERPKATMIFDYSIKNQNEELLTIGQTTLVFVNKHNKRPMRCPNHILTLIENASVID
jgi:acyl-CoA thioester hydrolase